MSVNIFIKRNVVITLVLSVLMIFAFYYYYLFIKAPAPSPQDTVDTVKLIVKPINLPEEFKKTLQHLEISGLMFITKNKEIMVTNSNGTPIDLCRQAPNTGKYGQPSCKLGTSVKNLVSYVSGAGNPAKLSRAVNLDECGYCFFGGMTVDCNTKTNRWTCKGSYQGCGERCR